MRRSARTGIVWLVSAAAGLAVPSAQAIIVDLAVGGQQGAQTFLYDDVAPNATNNYDWNFGISTAGGDLGMQMDSIRIYLKGNSSTVTGGNVSLSIYSGLGGAGHAGNVLLGVATIPAASLTNQFDPYDVKFAGNVLLNLPAGAYSMTLSVPAGVVVKNTSYLFKSGTADVVDANGAALSSSLLWVQDANSTGTAQTYFSGTAATPLLADPRFSTRTLAFGNYRVGSTVTQNTTLSNAAFYSTNGTSLTTEAVKVTGVTLTGVTTATGTAFEQTGTPLAYVNTYVNGTAVLNAPSTASAAGDSTVLTIGLNTSTAGPIDGSANKAVFQFQSVKGNSVSTAAATTLGSQTVILTGVGYRPAVGAVSSTNVSLGNFRVGAGAQSANITVSNTAVSTDAYSEKLTVASRTLGGLATAGTLPTLVAAGAGTSLSVGLSGITTAGTNSGTVVLGYNTDGTGTSGLAAASVGSSPTINVTATGYRTAAPVLSTTNLNLGNFRVGAGPQTGSITISNSLANDGYSEKVGIVDAATSGGATVGTIPAGLIAAGANASVTLGISGITQAGANTGSVLFGLKSSGTGTSGLSDLTLTSQSASVTAYGYRAAAYDAPDVDLGKYHTGATGIAGTVTVSNTVSSADAYSEKLAVTKNSVSGLTAGSVPAGLVAAGGNTSVSVNFSSVSAVGTNTASITFGMSSDGTGTSGLSALSLGTKTVNVTTTGYSGQSTWNQNTGGTWATFNNWDISGGKPGVDGALSVDDRATFGSGPTGATSVTLDGATPVLTQITFNNASASYTIGKGTGNGSITLGTSSFTASVTNSAGSHAINADVALARNAAFSVASGTVLTMGGALNGTGALSKTGTGTLYITGTGNLSGDTTVSAGRLRVNGSIASSRITVQNTAILSGSGTVGATTIQSGGTLAPGNSPGNLTITGNETWLGGGNYNWDLYNATGAAGTGWDLTTITGSLDLTSLSPSSKFNINVNTLSSISPDVTGNALNFNPDVLYTWKIATAAGGIAGFSAANFNLNLSANNGANGFSNSIVGTYGSGSFSIVVDGNDLDIVYTPVGGGGGGGPVPEPSTYGLGVGALAFAAGAVRRRQKAAKSTVA